MQPHEYAEQYWNAGQMLAGACRAQRVRALVTLSRLAPHAPPLRAEALRRLMVGDRNASPAQVLRLPPRKPANCQTAVSDVGRL